MENPDFLAKQIITYIGNKRSLLPLINYGVETVKQALNKPKLSCLDLFSGTGIVARLLKQHSTIVYANDLESYSRVTNQCFLANKSDVEHLNIPKILAQLKQDIQANWVSDGFIAELYSPRDDQNIQAGERVFYTRRNAEYLDTARQQIGQLPKQLQPYFLAPLIAKASVHTNTAGVFKGFYKNNNGVGSYGGSGKDALTRILGTIEVEAPILSNFECTAVVLQKDALAAAKAVPDVDLAYLDPPYNQHPYGSNYFMLNLLENYQKPSAISAVSGIPQNWNRSLYNKAGQAKKSLFNTITGLKASYILISYNSEGLISYDEFVDFLSSLGDLEVLETKYNTFRGSRNLRERDIHVKEYLFLLRKD